MSRDLQLQIRMNASGNARAMFEQITNAGNATSRALAAARKEANLLDKQQKSIAGFQKQQQALAQNESAIKKLTDEMRRSGTATAQQRRELTALHEKNRDLKRGVTESRKSYNELRKELKAAGIESKSLGANQTDLAKRMAQASAAADKQKARLHQLNAAQARYDKSQAIAGRASGLATNAVIKGAATMAAMSVPVRAYAESETASTDLRVAMMDSTGKVPAEYQKLDHLATSLGDKLPGTTADFKNLMTMLMRQGLSAQSVLGGTGEAAALLAVQLKQTPEAAAEMAAKLQDATRGTEKEMTAIMDSVQRMFYSGVDVENIVPAFANLAPTLDIMKIKGDSAMKQLSPLVGMLDQAGLSGESAGNALRKVFQYSMDTEKITKAIKGTGIDLNFTDGKGEFAGMENMYQQLAKMKNLSTEARLALIKEIWGDDAQTMQALNTMIEKGQAGYDEFSQKMANQAPLQQRVNLQLGTLTNLWGAATGSFTNLMASLGESIAPELKSITEWIANINGAMSNWAAPNPALAGAIMKTVAAVGLLFLAFAAVAATVATFLGPFAFLRFALVQVMPLLAKMGPLLGFIKMAFLALGRAMMANPILLAITLIISALYLLWKHWDTVKAWIIQGWQWIDQAFANNPILNALFPIVGVLRLLINNWSTIMDWIKSSWQSLSQIFANNPILGAMFPAIGAIQFLSNNWTQVMAVIKAGWSAKVALVGNNTLVSIMSGIVNAIRGLWNGLSLREIAANLMQGIISGIQSKITAVKAAWQSVTALFRNAPSAPAVKGPAQAGAKMAGFSSGGNTGDGGRNAVAGIVHRGEGVLNQSEISRIGGESGFNRLRQWIRNGGMSLLNHDKPKTTQPEATPTNQTNGNGHKYEQSQFLNKILNVFSRNNTPFNSIEQIKNGFQSKR